MYRKSFVRALTVASLALITIGSSTEGAFASGPASSARDCHGQSIDNYPTAPAPANAIDSAATVIKPQTIDPAGNNVTSDGASGGQGGLAKKIAKIRTSGGCLVQIAKTTGKSTAAPMTSSAVLPMAGVTGTGYSYLGNLVQQPQITNSWCGEATVSEMALTVPGPSYTYQTAVAAYWGASAGSGTSTSQLTDGLNHFVGVPDYGYSFYSFTSWLNDPNPTQFERDLFLEYLQLNVGQNSPVAGDAYEVPGGPHLLGHPTNKQIFHWFEIGGWNTNNGTILYADSVYNATTVSWYASVTQPLTWFNTYTAETIMGGRGYVA